MKSEDIVQQLALRLPTKTDEFTDNISVTSLTRSGTTVTGATPTAHGLAVSNQVNITGAQTPISVDTLTRFETVGTLVTTTNHDFTEGFSTTVEIDDAVEAEFNGTFTLLTVPNRKTATFTMADSGATTATGTPLLLNGSSVLKQYNGLVAVTTVPTTTTFTYEISDATLFTPARGTIAAKTNPRISSAVDLERAVAAYTEHSLNDLWAFVILNDVTASKDRDIISDAVSNLQHNNHIRQQVIQPFTIAVFIPSSAEIAGSVARDLAEDIFVPICQSVYLKEFDSGFSCGGSGVTQFTTHGFGFYNTAFYVHLYSFEQTQDLTFGDSIGFDDDVAFRDLDVTMNVDVGTGVMTADMDLDDDPLP